MRCACGAPATTEVRHGLEWHPYCAECAGWWAPTRHRDLPLERFSYRAWQVTGFILVVLVLGGLLALFGAL